LTDWFARPVFHVTDVEASVRFYVDRPGFTTAWRHEEEGKLIVAQVDRDGCALILACNLSEKVGNGTMFISLDPQPWSKEAQARALDALRAEFTDKGAEVEDGQWGYRVIMVADPDGNTLLFNYTD
jgi:catechol 2,3-dioxygenase-like lactoylglutathione lyase family enzyme